MKTKLQLVNDVLRRLGKMPIAALGMGALATQVENVLDDEARAVQRQGWQFNTKYDVEMTPNSSSKLDVRTLETGDVFHIDTFGADAGENLTRQGDFLYDLGNNSDTFTGSIRVTYAYELAVDAIPEAFQDWVSSRTAMRVGATQGAEAAEMQLMQIEVMRNESIARRDEIRRSDVNVLNTADMQQIRGRPRTPNRSIY